MWQRTGAGARRGLLLSGAHTWSRCAAAQDLIQGKDRHKWYEARFCAEDQPSWNIGRFLANVQVRAWR
jgi:hypothetical protein